MIAFRSLASIQIVAFLVWAIDLPPEPKFPTDICIELKANIKESPVGYIPEADEAHRDTIRIQEALDYCFSGRAVKLVKGEGNAFLTGHLRVPSGVSLWIDEGVTLFASRDPRDFDNYYENSCGNVYHGVEGCLPLILVHKGRGNGIFGDGVIDGRGGQKMIGSNETWWELALRAKYERAEHGAPRLIVVENSEDFVLYRIRLHNSPFWHFATEAVVGLTVWGVKVDTPSIAYPDNVHARNTDGFDPNGRDMVITQCYIKCGDDNIAIKAKKFPVENVLILDNHFYNGHGMSIGSEINEGALNVTIRNLTIVDAQNGLRIKSDASKGGNVRGILYENVCIRNTEDLLVFDTYYSNSEGSEIPNFHDINITNTRLISSPNKTAIFRGFDKDTPLKIYLDNVVSDVEVDDLTTSNAEITLGPGGVVGIAFEEDVKTNVKIIRFENKKTPPIDCSNAFVPFPR